MMSRAALALALSALLAATALPAAAAAAPADCASKVANAVSLCKGELQSILWRAQSGLKADITALSPTPQCCGAASAAFDPAFVSACGCDAGVIKQTVAVDAALLETLRGAVAAKCSAASLAPFPACGPAAILAALPSAEAYAAAAAAAAAAVTPQAKTPVTRRPTAARIVNGVVIKAGPGAYCTYTAKCKTFRFKPTTKNATLEKTLTAWRAKAAAGFCTKTASPIGTDDSELGIVVCGNNGVDNFFVEKETVVVSRRNNVTRQDLLYKLCQPKGSVYSDARAKWFDNLNMCSKSALSCFPGAAAVRLPGGAAKAMRDLEVGDKVMVVKEDGSTAFDDVIFFDHQVDGGDNHFVRLELSGGRALELSPGHFVPVGQSLAAARMTRARDVSAGDALLVLSDDAKTAAPAVVERVSGVSREGMFAPVTNAGTVVVDGVLASSYSDWVLDPIFDAAGLTHKLHSAMHAVHAPLRWGYAALGPRVLRALSPLISGVAMLDTAQIAAGLGLAVSA